MILTRIILLAAPALLLAQNSGMLPTAEAFKHYDRTVQLMEAATAAVPGLSRAAAPVIENTRQSVDALRRGTNPTESAGHYAFLTHARSFLALSDALPKPHPFPDTARKQLAELRDAVDRAEVHFRGLLAFKERAALNPDRDNLRRYAEANGMLAPVAPGKSRVVFLGDSITDGWRLNEYFPGKDVVNRGISGQTTSQMLGRMMADVVRSKPAVMVLLGGTNDIARGVDLKAIQDNITMIASLAEANKIKPVLASILPIHDYNKDKNPAWEVSKRRPPASINAMNEWIRGFCRQKGYTYLDYFTPMVDPQGFLKADLAEDGLHPNAAGYQVMAPLAASAIEKLTGTVLVEPPKPQKRRLFGGK